MTASSPDANGLRGCSSSPPTGARSASEHVNADRAPCLLATGQHRWEPVGVRLRALRDADPEAAEVEPLAEAIAELLPRAALPDETADEAMLKLLVGRRFSAAQARCLYRARRLLERGGELAGLLGAAIEPARFAPGRRVRDHLLVLGLIAEVPSERLDQALELVRLAGAADVPAGALSQGMRKRLALVAALLGRPRVLLLDEPGSREDRYRKPA